MAMLNLLRSDVLMGGRIQISPESSSFFRIHNHCFSFSPGCEKTGVGRRDFSPRPRMTAAIFVRDPDTFLFRAVSLLELSLRGGGEIGQDQGSSARQNLEANWKFLFGVGIRREVLRSGNPPSRQRLWPGNLHIPECIHNGRIGLYRKQSLSVF